MNQQQESPKLSKAESARINGALSNGPVTPQGQANSANGNLKHGAYSKRILMDGECAEGYECFKNGFLEVFLPSDAFETECVESMVTARWRIRRLESTEASNLNIALAANKQSVTEKFEVIDVLHERAIAVQSQMAALEANTRVQERLHRFYDRNYKLLAAYRRKAGRQMPSAEPVAAPEPASAPDLTDQPNSNQSDDRGVASTIAKVAMFLILFASLFMIPRIMESKTMTPAPAFHASHLPRTSK